jgi:hypothetical protein
MRPSEIARFGHAFYRVWAIGVMATAPHLQDQASAFLNKYSPRELCGLDELGTWANSYNMNDFGPVGLDLNDEAWRAGCDLVTKRWRAYQNGRQRALGGPYDTPMGFYAFFDHTQKYLDGMREDR